MKPVVNLSVLFNADRIASCKQFKSFWSENIWSEPHHFCWLPAWDRFWCSVLRWWSSHWKCLGCPGPSVISIFAWKDQLHETKEIIQLETVLDCNFSLNYEPLRFRGFWQNLCSFCAFVSPTDGTLVLLVVITVEINTVIKKKINTFYLVISINNEDKDL